jgi:hypothetical protein
MQKDGTIAKAKVDSVLISHGTGKAEVQPALPATLCS